MLDLLLFPISFCIVLAFYKYLEQQKDNQSKNSNASINIVRLISTNNNYDSIGDTFNELSSDKTQTILGEPLYADMKGYM